MRRGVATSVSGQPSPVVRGELVVTLVQAVGPDARELGGVEVVRKVGRAVARVDGRDVAAERVHGRALDRDRKTQGHEQRRESGEVHAH